MFSIKEGDTLMVMGDRKRGIALLKDDLFYQLMGGVIPGGGDPNDKPDQKL